MQLRSVVFPLLSADAARPGYAACSGCGLCLLPCPVWRQTGDVLLTPKGRARALQGGARPADLAGSASACLLCGACEPICPEGIDTVGMALELKAAARRGNGVHASASPPPVGPAAGREAAPIRLLPGPALASDAGVLDAAVRLLGGPGRVAVAADDGRDIAEAVAAGLPVDARRAASFAAGLTGAREVVLADGLLLRFLRRRLPRARAVGLAEALLRVPAVRSALRATDMYVIEPQVYHADYQRLVRVYDSLRRRTGCQMNLDLHRLAIPTGVVHGGATRLPPPLRGCGEARRSATREGGPGRQDVLAVGAGQAPPLHRSFGGPGGSRPSGIVDPRAQVRWILEGRRVDRIVVEAIADRDLFGRETGLPVLHLAELPGP